MPTFSRRSTLIASAMLALREASIVRAETFYAEEDLATATEPPCDGICGESHVECADCGFCRQRVYKCKINGNPTVDGGYWTYHRWYPCVDWNQRQCAGTICRRKYSECYV